MFVFAVALVLLTLFLMWIRSVMAECYLVARKLKDEYSVSELLYNDSFCSSEVN